ncbi:MAG: beta-ketoacyl synthase N-terminal-like domain-containing protein [Vicinamibacterales bacterium]
MPKPDRDDVVLSGLGITSAIGQGREAFATALFAGTTRFRVMERPGRQSAHAGIATAFLGAEIESLRIPEPLSPDDLRTASFSARVALVTMHEAWRDAALDGIDPCRIGLVVGGSNVQQRDLVLAHEKYRDRVAFLRPTYGFGFMDTDIVGLGTEHFGIRGPSFTVGGASASGQVAVIQGVHAVRSGTVDACIVVGALMDLSYWECQGLRAMGAMGSDRFATEPSRACRPFDRDSDGFIFGEACGAVVLERHGSHARRRPRRAPVVAVAGSAMRMDAHRGPDACAEGERAVIQCALDDAGIAAGQVEYVNPHGTGSSSGDAAELRALQSAGLRHARINATKSLTGHGLTAAGVVEIVATVIQMEAARLHPTRNLDHAADESFNWVGATAEECRFTTALTLSHGFGGVTSAICLRGPS